LGFSPPANFGNYPILAIPAILSFPMTAMTRDDGDPPSDLPMV
jgi:hypothetical protein